MISLVGGAIYFGAGLLHSHSSSVSNARTGRPLANSSAWELGNQPAKPFENSDTPDIGWWARTFDLPPAATISDYLKAQGLNVSSVAPLHYQDTTVAYKVDATVPTQLLRLRQTGWRPTDPAMARFTKVLVLNDGLAPGTLWDTQNTTVAADAGTELNFVWQVSLDKKSGDVTTNRLPFDSNVYTQEQVAQFQNQASQSINTLQGQIQQIDAQVQANEEAQLAQVPGDPPKPELLSRKWGGDGSGEPTKSAERIGGGTAAGAAGGAIFGGAAGDAGLGAGIGAGVGLLGGIIYDSVSKSNDRKRFERKVDAENSERMSAWHAQVKALDQERNQIKQNGVAERDQALTDLANRIAADQGRVDNSAAPVVTPIAPPPVPATAAPVANSNQQAPPAPPTTAPPMPTADQPTGPIRQP